MPIRTQCDFVKALIDIMRPSIAAMIWHEIGRGKQVMTIGKAVLTIDK